MRASLYERVGGEDMLHRLATAFYARVFEDELLLPLFRDTGEDHAHRLALWLVELLGGPKVHTAERGGFPVMTGAHYGLRISEPQRARWVELFRAAAREVGVDEATMADLGAFIDGGSTYAARVSWPGPERLPR